jgi:hypothetical protein
VRGVGADAPAELLDQSAGVGEIGLLVDRARLGGRQAQHLHRLQRLRRGSRQGSEDPLDLGMAQLADLEECADKAQPLDVALVVDGLGRARGPSRMQQSGAQVELDGADRQAGLLAQLADPHGVTSSRNLPPQASYGEDPSLVSPLRCPETWSTPHLLWQTGPMQQQEIIIA